MCMYACMHVYTCEHEWVHKIRTSLWKRWCHVLVRVCEYMYVCMYYVARPLHRNEIFHLMMCMHILKRMYIYTYTYTDPHIHTYVRTYIYTHTYIQPSENATFHLFNDYDVCVCVYIYIYIYIQTQTHIPTYIHTYIYTRRTEVCWGVAPPRKHDVSPLQRLWCVCI